VKDYTPRPYGALSLKHLLDNPRSALHARMGMGKTVISLSLIDALLMADEVERVLVLAPLRVARSTWPEEGQKWEQFAHLKFQTIIGAEEERTRALRNDKAQIYTINYDNIQWLMDRLAGEWPFDMVIADESPRLKSFRIQQGGKRAQAISRVAHRMRRWVNLTGLAAPNGLNDLWGQMWFLDQGFRLGNSFSAYQSRWFMKAPNAGQFAKTIPQKHAQAEIQELIKDLCLSLYPKDWFDLKDPVVQDVYVDLPPQARVHYREMENMMFT
jgi:SNF2 family DNA or RNA helicase